MRLQHAQYRAMFGENDYTPVIYFWEHGTFELPWVKAGRYHDLQDVTLPHCGMTTEHMAQMVGEITGRKVKRLVAW